MPEQHGDWKVFDTATEGEEAKKAIDTLVTNFSAKELTEEQKDFVNHNWDEMDLLSLVRATFKDEKLDGRSQAARLIKKYLGNRKPKTTKHEKVTPIILTPSQKEYIQTNVSLMSPYEMGKIMFENPKLEPLGKHMMAINRYVNDLDQGIERFTSEEVATEEYKPPTQLSAVVGKVNKYLRKDFDLREMPTIQKKTMESLRSFLHAPRFVQTINSYGTIKSRDMFEGEFIRTCFDKPDLNSDELNIAINLCQQFVMSVTIHKQLDLLNMRFEDNVSDFERSVSQSLAEMVKAKTEELNKCNKTISDLVKFLSGERSKRQEKQIGNSASIARLIEWWRDEEERAKALKIAERQSQEDEEEVERIENLGDIKARVLGISRSEMLYG